MLKLRRQELKFTQDLGLAFLKLLDHCFLLPQFPIVLRYQMVPILVLDNSLLIPLELPLGLLQVFLVPFLLFQDFGVADLKHPFQFPSVVCAVLLNRPCQTLFDFRQFGLVLRFYSLLQRC